MADYIGQFESIYNDILSISPRLQLEPNILIYLFHTGLGEEYQDYLILTIRRMRLLKMISRPIPLNMPSPSSYKQFETRRLQRTKAHLLSQPTPPAVLKLLRGRTISLSYLLRGMQYLGRMPVQFRLLLTGAITAKSPITPRQAAITSLGRSGLGSIRIIRTARGARIETQGAISQAKAMRKTSIGTKGPEMNAPQMRPRPLLVLNMRPRYNARP